MAKRLAAWLPSCQRAQLPPYASVWLSGCRAIWLSGWLPDRLANWPQRVATAATWP